MNLLNFPHNLPGIMQEEEDLEPALREIFLLRKQGKLDSSDEELAHRLGISAEDLRERLTKLNDLEKYSERS